MLSDYLSKTLKQAKFKLLRDGSYFGEIPGLKGVWANANTLGICRKELKEVLEGWLFLKIKSDEKISGFEIQVDQRDLVGHA